MAGQVKISAGEHVEWRLRYRTARSGQHDLVTTDAERAAFWFHEASDNEFCLDVRMTRRTLSIGRWEPVEPGVVGRRAATPRQEQP